MRKQDHGQLLVLHVLIEMSASGIKADAHADFPERRLDNAAEIASFEHGGFSFRFRHDAADPVRTGYQITVVVISVIFIQIAYAKKRPVGFCCPYSPFRCGTAVIIRIFPDLLARHVAAAGQFGKNDKIRARKRLKKSFNVYVSLLDSLYVIVKLKCKYSHVLLRKNCESSLCGYFQANCQPSAVNVLNHKLSVLIICGTQRPDYFNSF